MALFKALHGICCISPIGWFEDVATKLLGPDLVLGAQEKVKMIWERLLAALSRQKAYADKRRRELEFSIGDHVFIPV